MDKTEAGLGSNHSRADDRDKMSGHKGEQDIGRNYYKGGIA